MNTAKELQSNPVKGDKFILVFLEIVPINGMIYNGNTRENSYFILYFPEQPLLMVSLLTEFNCKCLKNLFVSFRNFRLITKNSDGKFDWEMKYPHLTS